MTTNTPNLKFGESYLLTNRSLDEAFDLFYDEADSDKKGLVIWRNHPKKISSKNKNIKAIWITNISSESEHLQPHEIEQLSYNIEQFMSENEHSIVMLSSIEYLVSFNTFKEILHLIQTAKDLAAEHNVLFLTYIGTSTLDKQEENLLRQELIVVGEHNG
jgi:hypothetical protein